MTTIYEPPQPNAALVVGPDDMLVVSFRSLNGQVEGLTRAMSPEEFARIRADFKTRFPEIAQRVVIVGNADQIAIIHKGQDPSGQVAG